MLKTFSKATIVVKYRDNENKILDSKSELKIKSSSSQTD